MQCIIITKSYKGPGTSLYLLVNTDQEIVVLNVLECIFESILYFFLSLKLYGFSLQNDFCTPDATVQYFNISVGASKCVSTVF